MTCDIAYFITAHGYGHGVRSCAVLNALPRGIVPLIVSGLPDSFFARELKRPYVLENLQLDCGCVQQDALRIDRWATLEKYSRIQQNRSTLMQAATALLRRYGVTVVVGDIPPLAFAAASACGLPSVATSNFTWADIYAEYVEELPAEGSYASLLAAIREDYGRASVYAFMEPGIPSPDFVRIEPVGLVIRPGTPSRESLSRKFGWHERKRWALIYVGQYGLEGVPWSRLAAHEDWEFLGLYPLDNAPSNYRQFDVDPSVSYSDITASVDLVIGKLGYGVSSECLTFGTPLVFPTRPHFREYGHLKEALLDRGLGFETTPEAFASLEFLSQLDAMAQKRAAPLPAVGVDRIAELISECL